MWELLQIARIFRGKER